MIEKLGDLKLRDKQRKTRMIYSFCVSIANETVDLVNCFQYIPMDRVYSHISIDTTSNHKTLLVIPFRLSKSNLAQVIRRGDSCPPIIVTQLPPSGIVRRASPRQIVGHALLQRKLIRFCCCIVIKRRDCRHWGDCQHGHVNPDRTFSHLDRKRLG